MRKCGDMWRCGKTSPYRQAAWDGASVGRFVYDGVYTSQNWLFLLHVGRMYPTHVGSMSSTNEHVCTCILKMAGKVHILYELSGTRLSFLFNSENVRNSTASVVTFYRREALRYFHHQWWQETLNARRLLCKFHTTSGKNLGRWMRLVCTRAEGMKLTFHVIIDTHLHMKGHLNK